MKILIANVGNYTVKEVAQVNRLIEDRKLHLYMWPEEALDDSQDLIGTVTELQVYWPALEKTSVTFELEHPHRFVETDGFLLVRTNLDTAFAIYQEPREDFDKRMEQVNKMKAS